MESLEKISDYSMQLRIAVAPHTEKGVGITSIQADLEELEKDIKNPERIVKRAETRAKLEELLLKQIASFEEG
ncbi:MAG: hypothetical protein QM401_00695 [Bacillota bacterium]|nr:hypothetical protein [Bacillota bacterium]